jgi:hypothetical protein
MKGKMENKLMRSVLQVCPEPAMLKRQHEALTGQIRITPEVPEALEQSE